jgi:hypothetical protein
MPSIDAEIEEITNFVDERAGNADRWTQQESLELYESVQNHAEAAAAAIREELGEQ